MPEPADTRGPTTTLEWATLYASLGWSVVPVRPGEKLPAVHWMAYQRQPASHAELHGWFAIGGYGIGLVQGRQANTIVLDFDGDEGHATLAALEERYGEIPATVRAITPGGGMHIILRHPGKNVPTRKKVLPGMDVRGDGGFIVAHPSRHENGRTYEWDVDNHPEDVPVADCPDWVAEIICGEAPSGESASTPIQMSRAAGPLGMPVERVVDGREAYMRDTILAVLVDLRTRLGRTPTEAELTAEAWPQYERKVDFTRPGRGPNEFAAKVRYTLARAARGLIRGIPAEGAPEAAADASGHDWEGDSAPFGGKVAEPVEDVFPTLSIEDIMALPPPTWLIAGLLAEEGFGVMYAPPESFKSFVALSMALSVAYDQPWMGRPVKAGGVLYVAAEGARGLGKRIRAWQAKHRLEGVDGPFRLLSATVNLTDPLQTAKLIRTAIAAAAAEGVDIRLVVIDTVARSMAGADENSATEMGRFVEACGTIAREVKAAILGIHHSGKDTERGARGSSALRAGVDTEIEIKRSEDRLELAVRKQKDDEPGAPIWLKTEKVETMIGLQPVSSLVVVDASADERPEEKPSELLLQIANALGKHKARLSVRKVGEALGMTSGPARQALAAAIPLIPGTVDVTVGDRRIRMWKVIEGDLPNSPVVLVREDLS
jgi:hypothetical protein